MPWVHESFGILFRILKAQTACKSYFPSNVGYFSFLLYSTCQIWYLWQSILHKVKGSFLALPFFFLPPIWLNWFISYYEHILSLKCDPWCFKWIHYRINDVMWLSFNFRALAMWSGNLDGNMTLPFSQLWEKTLVSPGCLF